MKWQISNDAPVYAQLIEQIQVGIVLRRGNGCHRCGTWPRRPG